MLPKIAVDGNFSCVDIGPVTLWFSYQTLIAFQTRDSGLVVRQNDWGPTTGKHMNRIDGGDRPRRIPGDEFAAAYAAQVLPLIGAAV